MKPALRRLAVPLILLLVVIGLPSPGAAVPPHLDLGFNAPAGYAVFAGWGSAEGSFNAAADQPDGKHVLVGVSGYDLLVARYNADWSVDASFGAGKGFALYETSLGNIERGYAVAIQPDGMIVAGGIVQDGVTYAVRPLVVRFTAAGELDTGFGGGDGAMAHESDAGEVRALLVQADGKILVGIDQGYSWQTILVRLNGDGTYDASFGGGSGRVAAAGSCFGLVPLADGKFVRAGSSYDGSNAWVWLRRFTRTGADDGSFGGSFTGDVRAACALPGGGVAVSGERFFYDRTDVFAVKYTAAGAPDTSFGGTGQVTWDNLKGRTENGRAVAPGPGGRIIVGGYAYGSDYDPLLTVLLANGTPDPEVGGGTGSVILGGGQGDRAFAVIPEAGGGIVLAGWTGGLGGSDAALWRFSATGVPDASFGGGDGVLTIDGSGIATDAGVQVAATPDGGVIVAGTSGHEGGTPNIVVLRYTAAGALDPSFGGGDGIFVYDSGGWDEATGLVVLPGGGIAVSGWRRDTSDDALVLKLTAAGALDPSFSGDGIFSWDGGDTWDYATGIAAAPGGGFAVSGITGPGADEVLVLKLAGDGALDASFSGDGVLTWGGAGAQGGQAVAVRQSDGEIFVAASTGSVPRRLALLKISAAGAIDGSVSRSLIDDFQPRAIALQPADGKVLVAGTLNGTPRSDVIVLRYTESLAVDTPFGGVDTGVFAFAGNPSAAGLGVLPLADGTILVTGQYTNALLVRLTAGGALDTSFDGDGWTTLALTSRDSAAGAAVDASGRYVIAGTAGDGTGDPDIFLARFNVAGVALHGLTVGTDGNGAGTVRSLPWIDCGADCTESFPSGTQVSLSPQPAPGSVFTGWAGDCSGPGSCTIAMTSTRGVTATFMSLTENTLTVSKSGTGSGLITSDLGGIDCGSLCQADYLLGTAVLLTPVAATGSSLISWSGCDAIEAGRCRVALVGDRTVEAVFNVPNFTLTVDRAGSGTVSPSSGSLAWSGQTGTGVYPWNTTVTLTPEPATGWALDHWTGACSGSGGCSVLMTGDRAAGAVFTITKRHLAVTRTGAGDVSATTGTLAWSGDTGGADYDYGTAVTLRAVPDEGYAFAGWTGDCSGTGDCVLNMTANRSAGAEFTVIRHRLTVTLAGPGAVTADSGTLAFVGSTGTADYDYGTPVTLQAAAPPGYDFAGWSGSCAGTGDCALTMSADRSVSARFNRPPTLEAVADQTVAEGDPLVFSLVAADEDGDGLTFTLAAGPEGATLDPDTGVFSWTPWWDAAGHHPGVRVEVGDGAATAWREFAIDVADTVNPPRVDEHFPGRPGIADPDWHLSPSKSWVVDRSHRYGSNPTVNALARAKAIDGTAPFSSGRISALMRLSTPYVSYANAAIVFGWTSPSSYRYVRLRPGAVLIGQVGTIDGEPRGVWSAPVSIALNRSYKVQVDLGRDGSVDVQVFEGTKLLSTHSHTFAGAAPGLVGVLTLKARSFVDDIQVQDASVFFSEQ